MTTIPPHKKELSCQEILIKELNETKNIDIYPCYTLTGEVYDYLSHSQNIDTAVIDIQEELTTTQNLIIKSTGEYVFVFEMFPEQNQLENFDSNNVKSICKVHKNIDLVNKSSVVGQAVLNNIFSKVSMKLDYTKLISDLWKESYFKKEKNSEKCLGRSNFVTFDYDWYDNKTYDIIRKRSILLSLEKDNRYFLLGSGIPISNKKKINKKDTKYYITLILFPIISIIIYLLILRNRITFTGNLVYIFIVIVSFIFLYNNLHEPGTYEKELIDSENQNKVLLGISAVIIGMSIVLKDMSFRDEESKSRFMKANISSFLLLILTLAVPPLEKTGKSVNNLVQIKYFVLFCALMIITASVVLYTLEK